MAPRHYTKHEATRLIKGFARNGSVRNTSHCKERMKQRHIDMQDILCAIRNGSVSGDPELDPKTNLWKYKVTGNGIDVEDLSIIITINASIKYITFITVFKENKQ